MIRAKFTEPVADRRWDRWMNDTKRRTEELVEEVGRGNPPKLSKALYKRMRDVLFAAFHGKCAYCETRFSASERGDVDHFRPQGAVLDYEGRPAMVASPNGGQPVPHPGYYWLAYDWHNLLPSCSRCNRHGKGARFPLASGSWATAPGEHTQERPLFIDPLTEDPARHLIFDPRTGVIGWKTQRGKACVELFDLNREPLPEDRRYAYRAAAAMLYKAVAEAGNEDLATFIEDLETLQQHQAGTLPYSLAARQALSERPDLLERLRQLTSG